MTDTVMLGLDCNLEVSIGLEYYALLCHLLLGKKIPFSFVCYFVSFSLLPIYHTILSIVFGLRTRKEV